MIPLPALALLGLLLPGTACASAPRAPTDAVAEGLSSDRREEAGRDPMLARAEAAFEAGDVDRARRLAEDLLSGSPQAEDALVARYLLRRLDAAPVDPRTIGVVLPLSGRFQAAGAQVRQAFEEGYRAGGGKRRLVFADSGADERSAVAALERLVLEQGAIAVVGPLRSDLADPLGRIADALRVPLVSLSQQEQPPGESRPWVFQGMVTSEMQAEALVDFLVDHRGMGAFAVFAPDTTYGRSSTRAFEAAVKRRGGHLAAVEFYDPNAPDLVPFARALGRKDYEARKNELWKLRKEAQERGGDPSKVVLPPKLDFDAIFVPDSPARIPIATAALAYEEFPIGEFRTSRHGPTVPLLGLNNWNDPSLVTRGNVYVRSSYFTATWFEADEAARAFSGTYRELTGRTPSALEALAYDTGRLVAAAAARTAEDRRAFRDALLTAEARGTVSGSRGFDARTRRADHRIRILTITGTGIVPVDLPSDAER